MAHYRIYFLGQDDHIEVPHDVDSDDDAAALLIAEDLLCHSAYLSAEVWHGNKIVARIALNPAEAANAPPPSGMLPEAAQS
jgi:hypothetical protein